MKKSFLIIGLIVLAVIIMFAVFYFLKKDNDSLKPDFNQQDKIISNPEEQTEYVGEQTTVFHKDFKAIMKKDWQEFESQPSTIVYIPKNTSEEDINAEIISVVVVSLGENNEYTLDNLLEQGIENSKQIMSDFELTESTDDEISGMSVKKIKFTGTTEGIKRNNIQIFGIKYNNLYAITYSCPVDICNSYAVYNSFIESFEPVLAK